jgi:AraC family transcriptional regulator, regulatory protein of adaptative response / methylated-DNA-[protein]-cysteine methyltransferase
MLFLYMEHTEKLHYAKIAEAIDYLRRNFKAQPSLEQLALVVGLSPFHFQKLFLEWAGVSPKKFLQYLSITYAKQLIKPPLQTSLFDAAHGTGLSGTGRLHDLFVHIEGMTPGEYKNGGASLQIYYSFAQSLFGEVLVASTTKGICHIAFVDDRAHAVDFMNGLFPRAQFFFEVHPMHMAVVQVLCSPHMDLSALKLHLRGTEFQLKVWEALLKIPLGRMHTYAYVASQIGKPTASRAVGSAIGDNPVAFLIPCHRVIRNTGDFGEYHWGAVRKAAILGWEAAQIELNKNEA